MQINVLAAVTSPRSITECIAVTPVTSRGFKPARSSSRALLLHTTKEKLTQIYHTLAVMSLIAEKIVKHQINTRVTNSHNARYYGFRAHFTK